MRVRRVGVVGGTACETMAAGTSKRKFRWCFLSVCGTVETQRFINGGPLTLITVFFFV